MGFRAICKSNTVNFLMRLKNKIALITGSARGIGQATAELFHKEGATVILSDITDKEGRLLEKSSVKELNIYI